LEKDGDMPATEMVAKKMPQEETEQHFSKETAELNFAAGWKLSATTEEKDGMGDHVDLPIEETELQPRRLQKESQPLEQLDEEIEQLRKMMLKSAEEISRGKLNNKGPTEAAGK
jgi:hypothetical protein